MIHFFRKRWQTLKKGAISVASLLMVTVGTQVFVLHTRDYKTPIAIRTAETEHPLRVQLASTPEEHAQGLMWVKSLGRNSGMLFVYKDPEAVAYWMKNMKMPIDILFIGQDRKIRRIVHEAYPCLEGMVCPRYLSPEPVKYVLELSAGYAERHQVRVGDNLVF